MVCVRVRQAKWEGEESGSIVVRLKSTLFHTVVNAWNETLRSSHGLTEDRYSIYWACVPKIPDRLSQQQRYFQYADGGRLG